VDDAKILKNELIMFKVDFKKAYDSVESAYLEVVMKKMGFLSKWCQWIIECVSSTT